MITRVFVVSACLVLLFASPASAENAKQPDTPKSLAKALKKGLGDGKTGGLWERAAALKGKFSDKEMQPLVKALGRAFNQSNKNFKILALKTLAELGVPGSYGQFSKLMKIPKKVEGRETRAIYLQAIKSAGALHEENALADIEKLLEHPDTSFARGAVWALAGYVDLEAKKKDKLIQRLVKNLAALERQTKDKKTEISKRATTLVPHVNTTLEKLTGEEGPKTAAEWEERLAGK